MLITFTILQKSVSIFLQAIGSPIEAAILSLARDVVAMVVFTILLPVFFDLKGVLWAAPAADIIGIILSVVFAISIIGSLKD